MKIETITPVKAQVMLKNNPINRSVVANHVARLAREMERGNWQLNGDTIRIDNKGKLLDGQHRLLACVKSGVPLKSYVIRDLSDKTINTIDVGKARNASDVFQIHGIPHHARASSVVYNMFLWDHQRMHWNSGLTFAMKPTHDDLYEMYLAHKKEVDSAVALSYTYKCNPIKAKNVAFAAYMLRKKYRKQDVENYLSHIANGGDYSQSPTHYMIMYVTKRMIDKLRQRHRSEDTYVLLHCFEQWMEGKKMDKLDIIKVMTEDYEGFYKRFKI